MKNGVELLIFLAHHLLSFGFQILKASQQLVETKDVWTVNLLVLVAQLDSGMLTGCSICSGKSSEWNFLQNATTLCHDVVTCLPADSSTTQENGPAFAMIDFDSQ